MGELVTEGKVLYIGSSNLAGWQVADADWIARSRGSARFVSAQNEYSLLQRDLEATLSPACVHYGVGILPFFPLASGLLTGKYRRNEQAPAGTRLAGRLETIEPGHFDVVEALEKYAAERGVAILDVAIGGLASRPAVSSVIAGATQAEQVHANVAAGSWVPSADDRAGLEAVLAGGPPSAA